MENKTPVDPKASELYSIFVQRAGGKPVKQFQVFLRGYNMGYQAALDAVEKSPWKYKITVFSKIPKAVYFKSSRRAFAMAQDLIKYKKRFMIQEPSSISLERLEEAAEREQTYEDSRPVKDDQ